MKVKINQSFLTFTSILVFLVLLGQIAYNVNFTQAGAVAINEPVKKAVEELKEDPLLASFSSEYLEKYQKDTTRLNSYGFAPGELPEYSDNVYKARMKEIEKTIPLVYNSDVKAFMDLYLVRKRPLLSRIVGRSYTYFDMFEKALKENNMPEELKYLAVVESALNPEAISWAGAAGMWQFMPPTAREYNLTVNAKEDDRMDPEKSTDAAVKYLKYLHNRFGDWGIALAAYNYGPGNVNKAIRKAGLKGKNPDFWAIKRFLPKETQSYVPAFIAAAYMMNYFPEHNLKAIDPRFIHAPTDAIAITENTTFHELAMELEMTPEELAYFNPDFEKTGKVNVDQASISLIVPQKVGEKFKSTKVSGNRKNS